MQDTEKTIDKLMKEKEDIETLLSSLEEAYSEASITEKNYKELKTKNKKRLAQIKRKITLLRKKMERERKKALKEQKKKQAKPEEVTPTEPTPAETDLARASSEPSAQPTPSLPHDIPQVHNITKEELKEMLGQLVKEAKLVDIAEIQPKIEKMSVDIEKIKAFLDAVKEERKTGDERIGRISEELGELRSGVHSAEGRLSEQEMKLKDINELLSTLRPERFNKFIREIEANLKQHEARLLKLEDVSINIQKKLRDIKEILQSIGSIENIAKMNRELSKKLISINEHESKITRLSDKIENIFVEMNKRLDEFIFYKAKQESLTELVNEMMKSLDEMNTKLGKFVEKVDLEALRDTFEAKIDQLREEISSATPPELKKLQQQKNDIEDLLSVLEEQHKTGNMPDKDYEKIKKENEQKLKEIEEKIQALSQPGQRLTSASFVDESASDAEKPKEAASSPTELKPQSQPPPTTAKETKPQNIRPELHKIKSEIEKTPSLGEMLSKLSDIEKQASQKEPAGTSQDTQPTENAKAPGHPKDSEAPVAEQNPPQEEQKTTSEPAGSPSEEKQKPPEDPKKKMLLHLEDSYKKGLISREAYERTKKIIEGK